MASNLLGIDLDAAELRLAELTPGGGGFTLTAALTLPVGAADPVTLGNQLKEQMKANGFKATSAVIALGHDALTTRVVRHPDIPEGELPAVVQFQVMKESTIPADDSIVDYVPLKQPLATGERRSLTYVVRKGRVLFCEKLCEAAGLNLLAVVPRAVALAASLTRGRNETTGTAAFAAANSFFVLGDGDLIFNRGLALPYDAADFAGELRRSIAAYESQPSVPALGALFVANTALPSGAEALFGQFRVPTQLYDPYAAVQGADRLRGDFAVALGAAQVSRAFRKPPVDFANPKKVVVKPNNTKKYATWGAIAAGVLAVVIGGGYWMLAHNYDNEIAEIQGQINQQKENEKTVFADVDKKFEIIDAWNKQEVFILEELYDLVATFPDVPGVQIMHAEWKTNAPAPGSAAAAAAAAKVATQTPGKSAALPPSRSTVKPIARLTIKATAENETQLQSLETALRDGKHWKFVKFDPDPREKNTRSFELDILPLSPADYAAVIQPGKNVTATGDGQQQNTRRRPGFRPTR